MADRSTEQPTELRQIRNYTQRPDSGIPFADADSFTTLGDYTTRPVSCVSAGSSGLASSQVEPAVEDNLAFKPSPCHRDVKTNPADPADGKSRVPTNGDVVIDDVDYDDPGEDVLLKCRAGSRAHHRRGLNSRKGSRTTKRSSSWLCFGRRRPRERQSQEIKRLKAEARRQQCLNTFFTFIYILLAILAVVFTYSLVLDLLHSMKNPVRSLKYSHVQKYDPPGKTRIFPHRTILICLRC